MSADTHSANLGDSWFTELITTSESLESIEIALWLIVVMLFIVTFRVVFRDGRPAAGKKDDEGLNWNKVVEEQYDKGNYSNALESLATYQLVFEKSASIIYWQGRCYFQMEDWEKAVEKFEECCRLEPPYRSSVRDYMAFIELNELVPGVEGYLDKL